MQVVHRLVSIKLFWSDKLLWCCEVLLWTCGAGGFSCERANLFSLHQLHRRTIWVIEGSIRAYLWSGKWVSLTKKFLIHLLAWLRQHLLFLWFSVYNCTLLSIKWEILLKQLYMTVLLLTHVDACYINKGNKQMFREEPEVWYDTLAWRDGHCLLFPYPLFQLVRLSS